uniref:Uncharacterized protein n=1 Tax=Tanacetum cinerariifolium TaxID=118510 RepID=A0A6L2NQV5_TANCI|nr:hypothetical protein [Tanacetum cinerariifolium]
MLEFEAYKTYYAYASREKTPKSKYVRKKADSDTSPKKKPNQATKAEQIKLATKRSKKYFHMSHTSGSSDGVDTQSKVPDEQQQKVSSTNEEAGVRPEVPDVPKNDSESDEESWTFSQDADDADEETGVNDDSKETEYDNDGDDLTHPNFSTYKADDEEEEEEKADDEEVSSDQRVSITPEYKLNDEEEEEEKADDEEVSSDQRLSKEEENKKGDDEDMEGEQEQDKEDDMYRDVNINPERSDVEMTNAQANQDTEDTHFPSLLRQLLLIQQLPNHLSPTFNLYNKHRFHNNNNYSNNNFPDIPNFASLFQFDQQVSALETKMSEFKQTKQFVEAVSSISGIVDNYLTSKMKEAVDVVVHLQTNKLKEEAQAENQEFLNQVDSTMKTIIKEQVQAQVSTIMPKIEKEVEMIKTRRSGQEVESSKEPTHKESKSTSSLKGASRSQPKSSGKSTYVEEHGQKVDDLEVHSHQEFNTGDDDVILVQETLEDASQWNPPSSPTLDRMCKSVVELKYHLEDVFKATNDRLDWHNPKGKPYAHDLNKPLLLIPNERGRQVIPLDHFINNDLENLKGGSSSKKYTTSITKTKAVDYGQEDKRFYGYASNMESSYDVYSRHKIIAVTSLKIMEWYEERYALNVALRMSTRRIVIQERMEDLQLGVKSYQKKINLTNPDTYRLDLSRMTPYTTYFDIQGIIYEDKMNRNHLMRTDELHKFNDGTLNHVRTALNDIATGIEMDSFPKRKWIKQDKQRARVMINEINKKLMDKRLMRNLVKFVGGRPYGGDLWLLERTI